MCAFPIAASNVLTCTDSYRPLGLEDPLSRFALIKAVLAPAMRLMFRPQVEGLERIPGEGPVILAGNHLTFIDSIVLPVVSKRQVQFIGKDEYVTGKGIKGRAMAWFFTGVGMIPVDRDGANGGVAALMTGRRVLEEGKVFGIYPEGTRSPDGRLYRGRTGIARLTLMTGAPVVPFAMIGTDKLQPGGRGFPGRGRSLCGSVSPWSSLGTRGWIGIGTCCVR